MVGSNPELIIEQALLVSRPGTRRLSRARLLIKLRRRDSSYTQIHNSDSKQVSLKPSTWPGAQGQIGQEK